MFFIWILETKRNSLCYSIRVVNLTRKSIFHSQNQISWFSSALSQLTSRLSVCCVWGQQQVQMVCGNLYQSLIFFIFHVGAGLINLLIKSCWSRFSGSVHQCHAEVSVVIVRLLKSLWWREVTNCQRPRRTTTCVLFLMCVKQLHHTCWVVREMKVIVLAAP